MSQVNLRDAHRGDAGTISHLITQHLDLILPFPEDSEAPNFLNAITPEAIEVSLGSGDFWYVLAECQGKAMGTIGIRKPNHLFHLFVTKDARGSGISRQLFETACQRVRRESPDQTMTVNATPNALAIYRHFGFEATAPQKIKNGVAFIPMILDLKDGV